MNTIQNLEDIRMLDLTKAGTEIDLTSSRLLRLPLEIRCLIYTFIAPPTRRPGPIPWIEQRFSQNPNFDLARYREFQPAFDTSSARKWKDGSERCGGLLSLAAANRQLYHEIRDLGLIGFPALRLGILDDQTLKHSASKEILELARQDFVRENVVAVEFFFAHKEMTDPDMKDLSIEDHFNLKAYFIKLDFLRSFFGRNSALLELHSKSKKHELKELVAVLATYPKIKSVKIRSDHSGFFEAWRDPKGNGQAFLPLLRRGVTVEFALDRKLYRSRREASFTWV
jgi:hypothetical protein